MRALLIAAAVLMATSFTASISHAKRGINIKNPPYKGINIKNPPL